MENKKSALRVGIIIPTFNRPDFVIRQLKYYAKLNSPHPVYIGDASNDENSDKLRFFIDKLGDQLTVFYYSFPKSEYSLADTEVALHSKVREKYYVQVGDDDYQIPDSITKCAEFLEDNPDYSSASGYAVSIRLKNNGVYGDFERLSDYPRRQIELSTAAERLISFMSRYYVPLFSVHRTEQMKKCWSQSSLMENLSLSTEIFPSAMSLTLGKSKIIDCLSFIRQIHGRNLALPDTFDWMMGKDWHSSFENFIKIMTQEVAATDNIEITEAHQVVKEASWKYIARRLSRECTDKYIESVSTRTAQNMGMSYLKAFKFKVGQKLPWVKDVYRQKIRPLTKALPQIHDDVLRKGSKYYDDFELVRASFTGL